MFKHKDIILIMDLLNSPINIIEFKSLGTINETLASLAG